MREAVRSLAGNDAMRESLLAMLFLGERTEGSDELRLRFTSCGLAHVLAISGLHLAILLGTTMCLLWCLVPSDSLRSIIAAVVVLGYAGLLEPRTSIERAAITMGVVLLGRACGAHWRTGSVLSLVFCIILWTDPSVLMLPGFQLSFGVTAGLSLLAGPCRTRWFGLPDRLGRTRWSIIRTRLIDGFCSATVAWLVGTPIVIHHFSQCAPAAVFATMAVSIPVVLLLGMGFPLIGLVVICPIASGVGSWLLIPAADLVLLVVDGFEWLVPARVLASPFDGWVFLAEFAVLMALAAPLHSIRRLGWGLLSLCMLSAMVGGRMGNSPSSFSTTALAVGNGSALLIRGGDTAVMFDAGSSSVPLVGERIIVPALRASGVRRIDAIVVSHANLDHVSGIPELLDAFVVDRILCSEQMLLRAWSYPGSVGSDLLDAIHERGVPIETIGRGDDCALGELELEVLHPGVEETCRSINDESVVGLIRHPETTDAMFLICGDAQDEALARVMHRYPDLQAHGMELPHHGSWREIAAEFVKRVDPMFVLQSTGHGRYMLDRWEPIMHERHRGVTTRDGAVELTLDDQPELEVFIQKK
jgi:competence protein ComEC